MIDLRLSEIRIQDFRTIADLWMPVRPSLVLLGENNAGKTSFLHALDVALGGARAKEEDLHRDAGGRVAPRFVIDLRFEPESGDEFDSAMSGALGNAIQMMKGKRAFFVLRTRGEVDSKRGDIALKRCFMKGWDPDRKAAEKLSEVSSVPVTRDHRELISFNLLDARRDAIEQLRNRRTFWGQLVSDLKLEDKDRQSIEKSLAEARDCLATNSPVLVSVRNDLKDISDVIAHHKLGVQVEPLPADVQDLLRAMDLQVTETGQSALPMAVQGMGTRSLSALLIFRAYVRSVLAEATGAGTLSVAAFEEPESHLHPHAQRAVLRLINKIPGQRLVSTHSPFVAGMADLYDLRVFRRTPNGTTVSWVPEKTQHGTPPFTNEEAEQLRRFIQLRKGEVLFARVVGLYEGDTEDAAFPVFARSVWPGGADSAGVSLVNVGGAGNYKHVITLLEALGIPWVIFSDGDQAGQAGVAAAGKAIGKTPLDGSSPNVVMLPNEQDFEAYIMAEGCRQHAEQAITSFFGPNALTDFKKLNHGQKLRKGQGVRDYTSSGWEERLVHDFMDKNKGTYGASLAEAVVKAGKNLAQVDEFLNRLKARLGNGSTP